ncbi:MAG TPA: ThiF family adenylyltransferase, partial [Candidatus Krumholzibacteria bacterium]|nr:ThiF family adenylyltransferase [Candidatus Krumholzibacteria bacterium]
KILPVEPLQQAVAVVGGAGALGNEVLKNLALLGVGHVVVCDFDRVEIHNLTRAILFRQGDAGALKAEVAAVRMREINPGVNAIPFADNIAELGGGFFRRAGLIFSTFDAFFPRYAVNEACLRYGKTWVDAGMSALEHTRGGVTVYDGADRASFCYACGTSPEMVSRRLAAMRANVGCTAYENVTGEMGGVPTTPMMASVIGGVQTAAGLDIFFHRRGYTPACEWPFGSWDLDISNLTHRRVRRQRMPDCYHHQVVESVTTKVVEIPEWDSQRTTYREVLDRAQEEFGTKRIAVDLPEDFYTVGTCSKCKEPWDLFRLKSTYMTRGKHMRCPVCGEGEFAIDGAGMYAEIDYDWEYLDRPMAKAGARPLDVLKVVKYDESGAPDATRYWEVSGDAKRLGLPESARATSVGVVPSIGAES